MSEPKSNETEARGHVGSGDWLGCRARITQENLERCRQKQWERNKSRLLVVMGNILTLGLGENLWYGDRLDRKVYTVTTSRFLGQRNVNIKNSVSCAPIPEQISDARDVVKGKCKTKTWVFGRYKVTIECLHKNVNKQPNVES